MMIHHGQTSAVINGLQDAMQDGKSWFGIHQSVQQLSITDLHFFETYDRALDFSDFNQQQQKQIVILPVELTYEYLVDRLREAYQEGQVQPSITLETKYIQDLYETIQDQLNFARLAEQMDDFDWSKVFYDPLESNTDAESFEDKQQFNKLETLIEELSSFANINEASRIKVSELLLHYWKGEPMEAQVEMILDGNFLKLDERVSMVKENEHPISSDVLDLARIALAGGKQWMTYNHSLYLIEKTDVHFFSSEAEAKTFAADNLSDRDAFQVLHFRSPEDILRQIPYGKQSILSLNQTIMNMENLQYLKDNIKYTGFGEALYTELEKNIGAKKDEFQLHFNTQIGNRPFDAVLDFRKSNTSDMYFFNRYKASIEKSNGEKIEQSFQITKGKGVTAKEAYNLLQGRAVKREMTNAKGEEYQAWMQFDFDNKDEKGNFKVNKYTENYGYDLRESIARFPVFELDGGDKEKDLLRSLEKGNAQMATMDKDGEQIKIFLEANPKYKTINVYDEQFKMMKHEELPKAANGQRIQQDQKIEEPKQEVKHTNSQQEKQTEKKRSQKNEKGLISKKRVRNQKGVKV